MVDVLLIGRYPPPLGGNTVHIQRLAQRLLSEGYSVKVLDLYGGAELCDMSQAETMVPVGRRGSGWSGLPKVFRRLAVQSKHAVVHFHVSAGNRFYSVLPILILLTSNARRRVLTIHSGSWINHFTALRSYRRRLVLWFFGRFINDIICVNKEQSSYLIDSVESRVHVIPAYLEGTPSSRTNIPLEVARLLQEVEVLIVTSGYGTEVYDYLTVFRGGEWAQARGSRRVGIVVATYTTWDKDYWDQVTDKCERSSVRIVITKNLTPDEFNVLLEKATVYVRATISDGDSVAVREASAMGVRVLASDCVERPPGTALFTTGSAESLGAMLIEVTSEPRPDRVSRCIQDNFQAIKIAYGLISAGG
jgi:glycosyltransferase involved in cell wall biosynthesis